jgi:hypothetical protein
MVRNNDCAADGDGISIIRLTGVVGCGLWVVCSMVGCRGRWASPGF